MAIIALVTDIFLDCKYTNWYFKIINSRPINLYGEKHHIIPKSLGGNNDSDNIIFLSYREHYICHMLLTKMCKDSQHKYKMIWALHRMTFSGNYDMNSRHYSYMRKIHKQNLIDNHPSKHMNNYFEICSTRAYKGYKNNPNLVNMRSETFKKFWANTETRKIGLENNRINGLKGAIACKLKTTGIPKPTSSQPGNKNARAKLYYIVTPNNYMLSITTEDIKNFCLNEKISKSSLLRHKKSKGYKVIKSEPLNNRRISNG